MTTAATEAESVHAQTELGERVLDANPGQPRRDPRHADPHARPGVVACRRNRARGEQRQALRLATKRPCPARGTRRPLRFSKLGDEGIERAYRTHWVSPELSERRRDRFAERKSRPPDLVVVSPVKEWTCSTCGSEEGGWLIMEDRGPVCMACADMDHLVFLPSGDAALTRRAKKSSRLSAVVVRFSRARKRSERPGILVEEEALERAEQACLADEESRARRRDRDAARRSGADLALQARLAVQIRRLFPGCPPGRPEAIAQHAAQRGSAGLDAPRPDGRLTRRRWSWRCWRRCATKTPDTTS